ncbi:hypothetical protein Tco_1112783 [Tanacetum coccineum]|uniref:Uncharacterized protein n=1 Tax=Tanacetum coccineum TaxID=301880 RepID=A0ABQ5IQA3_9ASTR
MLAIQAEEGEGSGHPSEPQPPPSTAQPTNEEPIPNVVSSSHQKTQTPRQALNKVTELPQTSEPIPNVPDEAVYEEWDDRVERATTTAASLDAEQASGNINRTQSTAIPNVPLPQGIGAGGSPRCQEAMGGSIAQTRSERVPTPPRDSPLPRVHTLGSDEGSMTLQELTVLCTTLSKKVESLEADLKQTKQVYGAAYTKLIMKVKKLEKTIKTSHSRRRAKIVVSDDEDDSEDPSKQGRMIDEIDQGTGVTLVTPTQGEDQPEVLADATKTYTKRRRAVSTGSGRISTVEESVSTAGASMPVSTAGIVQEVNISIPSPVVVKDKGKAAVRLQEELDEEERQRMIRVHEAAQYFTREEWENIRTRVEADEELSQRLQAEERNKYKVGSSKRAAEAELDHEGSKRQKTNEASGSVQEQPEEELSNIQSLTRRDDLVMLWNLIKERSSSTEPTDDKERALWGATRYDSLLSILSIRIFFNSNSVMDIHKRTQTKAKRTKPSTGMEKARENEAEGIFILNGPTYTHLLARESTIPLSEIISQLPLSIAITPVLPTVEPEDSLNMGDEHLSTIPEKGIKRSNKV